jgi:hypothetical protein
VADHDRRDRHDPQQVEVSVARGPADGRGWILVGRMAQWHNNILGAQ